MALVVNVTMMCGCPIAEGKPWVPGDFAVTAAIRKVGGDVAATVPLAFQSSGPSRFAGSYRVKKPGYYQAEIAAVQKSTGNTGVAIVTFYFQPPGA